MKRITLFLLLALYLSLQAFAQIRIGVDAGMNLTHFKSSDNYVQKIGGMGTGFQIGGTLDYEFKKHWMLMSGVSFMQTQSRMEMEYGMLPRFPDAKIKLNHIVIPLKVGYKFKISKTLSLIPQSECMLHITLVPVTAHWTSNLRLTARRYMRNGIR